ncbi:MAG: Ig-like domain-containing protein [Clostridia bacterium]|nr:Ig-like domain-containing protein [Clostridia bacterium]
MKKTFRIKTLVLCMLAMMVLTFVPNVQAAGYVNTVEDENDAAIVCSMMADKTDVKPGDVITVTLTLDKVPASGLSAIDARIIFDSSKVKLQTYEDEYGDEYLSVIPEGVFANTKRWTHDLGTVADDEIANGVSVPSALVAKDIEYATSQTGTVCTYKFEVLNTAEGGPITMYVKSAEDNGFYVTGVKEVGGVLDTDDTVTRYLKTNLTDIKISVPATGVKFDGITGATLDTAENKKMSVAKYVVIDPTNTTDTMSWSSENENVATVDSNGVITAVGKGTTNVVVKVGNYTAKLPVTVTIPLEGVEFKNLDKVELDVTTNKVIDISGNVNLLPAGAEAAGYEWSSSDETVVTVKDGLVTAVGKGTAEITVKVGKFEATVPVTVTASVGSVSFDLPKLVLDTETKTEANLKDSIVTDPVNADVKSITWESSDEDVVTVDAEGKVKVVGKGTAEITVTVDGKTATIPVSVTVPIKGITVDVETVEVFKGDVAKVVVTATPEGAEWTTLDASFRSGSEYATAKSVEDGVEIEGLAEGEALVVIAADKATTGELVKLVKVVVKENKVTDFQIDGNDEAILRGEVKELGVVYGTEIPETEHETTDDTTVTWESLNEDIATVDENGTVTGLKEGTATIKATMAGFTDTFEVTVEEIHADGIVFTDTTIEELEKLESVLVGDKVEIPFIISPEDCTDTLDEILDYVVTVFDEELVDVKVEYDMETKVGKLTVTAKKAGTAEVVIAGADATEEDLVWLLTFEITEPVVEEEPPATGDMPVALFVGIMMISLAGIVVSKKVLVK